MGFLKAVSSKEVMSRKEENIHNTGYVLGVLQSAEYISKSSNNIDIIQKMINELLAEKMKFLFVKQLAKQNNILIDWKAMDIKIKRTD